MDKQPLHITNGSVLTSYLNELDVEGEKLTWQEMLCEGPTLNNVNSEAFLKLRASFLKEHYDIDLNIEEEQKSLDKLNHTENYSEIILWFEYDLFCHINLLAVIKLIDQKKINLPLFLVCSGKIEDDKNLKGLSELTADQLISHYQKKVKLNTEDIQLAATVWGIYCGIDHNLLKPFIKSSSNTFIYLSSCLAAHLERFPCHKSGLNTIEKNILKVLRDHTIKSKDHLLGYAMNYQGYYGFGDIQLLRIINKLDLFYTEGEQLLTLNKKGIEALLETYNFSSEINNKIIFGGINKLDFYFNKQENTLIKIGPNAS